MSASPHLVRRGNTFHFRIAVPRELVARIGKVEIKTTLRTSDLLTAKQRGRVLSSAIEALFEEVRRMPELTRQHVERRVTAYFQDCLDKSQELADLLPQDRRSWDRDAEVAVLRRRIDNLTQALTDRDFSPALEREVLEILHPDQPDAAKGDLDTFRYACGLVLRAKIQDAKLLAAEFMGEPMRPTDPAFEGMRALGYGNGMSSAPLKEETDRIKPPIDLVALLEEAQQGKVDMTGAGWQSRSRRRPRSLTSPQPPSNLLVKRRGRPRKTASNPTKDQPRS